MKFSRVARPTVLLSVLIMVAASCSGDSRRSAPITVDTDPVETIEPLSATTESIPAATAPVSLAPTPTAAGTTTIAPTTTAPVSSAPTSPAPGTTTVVPTTTAPMCGDLNLGATEFTLSAGGADHPARVFVPSTFSGVALPLVVNWHGLGGNGPQQAAVTLYEELAEAEGFIAVHPTGVPSVGDSRNSWQLAPSFGERDDLAFANELLDHLISDWCVDADRIYSTGISNGGFFTARLVCEMADRLAAASSVAGLYHVAGCAPSRPVPYLAYHGTDDEVVPFDGDGESVLRGADGSLGLRVFFEQVMPEEFAEFAGDAGCDPVPSASAFDDVIRYDYAGCTDDTPMSFFEISGGGHTWPNWPIAAAVESTLGYTTTAVDATVDSWEFFEQHTLGG